MPSNRFSKFDECAEDNYREKGVLGNIQPGTAADVSYKS
jgi:hypothetical protein